MTPPRSPLSADQAETIPGLVGRLIDDTRAVAGAEIALYKAKLGERVAAYRNAIIYFAIAGVLALAGFIAFLVGAILALSTLIGPGFATAAVVVVVFAIAAILTTIGRLRMKPVVLEPMS